MRKIKQINLLQTKEKLNQRKTISHLESLNAEAEKCEKVSKELEEIAKEKNTEFNKASAYSFQANRQLLQKLMEQREILVNRQEFLHNEKMAVTSKISQSKAKNDLLERKKLQEKVKLASEKELKREEDYSKIGKP